MKDNLAVFFSNSSKTKRREKASRTHKSRDSRLFLHFLDGFADSRCFGSGFLLSFYRRSATDILSPSPLLMLLYVSYSSFSKKTEWYVSIFYKIKCFVFSQVCSCWFLRTWAYSMILIGRRGQDLLTTERKGIIFCLLAHSYSRSETDSVIQFMKYNIECKEILCDVHYFRRNEPFKVGETMNSSILCCLAVPSALSLDGFLDFMQPYLGLFNLIRFLRYRTDSLRIRCWLL